MVDAATGAPLIATVIELELAETRAAVVTDSAGRFHVGPLSPGTYPIRASRVGYMSLDTVLRLAAGEAVISLALRVQPIQLRPLTVKAERAQSGPAAERALFEREVVPGVVGISRREIRALPALAEPDLLRSLQALPGVIAVNDLSAELHVRGGGPDQNLFLLDGARIFAPYHMFGLFGAFNADAVGRVDFFRGGLPARFGGALSSVIDIEQWSAAGDTTLFEGGLSLLGARLAGKGTLPVAKGQWLLAARRTHADLVAEKLLGTDFPYAFHDLQGRVSFAPTPGHRVRASFFTSSDRFQMFLGGENDDLRARWRNLAGSLHWSWVGNTAWSATGTAWGSLYDGTLAVGSGPVIHPTRSRVGVGGIRLEAVRRGEAMGLRVGLDAKVGRVALLGSEEPDGYIQGRRRTSYALPAFYVEAERWLGAVRLAPGLRAGYETSGERWLIEPRLAARVHLTDEFSLTLGAGRTRQVLSTVRDDRYILPGPPLWLLHPDDAPASMADGVDAVLDGWHGHGWSYHVGVYARRFKNVPRWRPEGTRELSRVAYDDGQALGLELMVRRHEGQWTGWLGYGLSRARFAEGTTGTDYFAAWDRRHAVDAALFWQAADRLSLSARITYGSGTPFWPIVGLTHTSRLVPFRVGRERPLERLAFRDSEIPVWAEEQQRLPSVFRVDLAARYRFRIAAFDVTPYASVLNVTARPNVLYYELETQSSIEQSTTDYVARLEPVEPYPFAIFPSVGFDIRF